MNEYKVVTVDDLRRAILTLDDKEGHDRWTIQEVFDALPAPPLDADVQAAVEECESAYCISLDAGVAECPELCRCKADQSIINALLAGAAANAQLRAAATTAHDWCTTDNDSIDRLAEEVAPALSAALAAEPSALAERYRALLAMEERAKGIVAVPRGKPEHMVWTAQFILHGEVTDVV